MIELSSLIAQLYDAATDPGLWPGVLGQLDRFFDTTQTILAIEDAVDPSASVFHSSVDVGDWVGRYTESYMLMNPMRLAMVGRVRAGDTVLTKDFMTPAEYSATRFSKELLAERRIADIAVAILEMSASRITVLSAQRSVEQGFADEMVRRKLEIILPHAQRAVRISGLLEHRRMASETLADTLDTLAAAVVLLTGSGGIVHANAQAIRLMKTDALAHRDHGRLVLWDKAATAALSQALDLAAQGDGALGAHGRSIAAMARDDRKFVVTVMPLTSGRRREIGSSHHAVAAVCLKEAEFEVSTAAATLATFYDLTRREMAVLVASVELSGATEVAAVMGLTEHTVRSHLKAIFLKTGATRQADLVKLMAGTAPPVG